MKGKMLAMSVHIWPKRTLFVPLPPGFDDFPDNLFQFSPTPLPLTMSLASHEPLKVPLCHSCDPFRVMDLSGLVQHFTWVMIMIMIITARTTDKMPIIIIAKHCSECFPCIDSFNLQIRLQSLQMRVQKHRGV